MPALRPRVVGGDLRGRDGRLAAELAQRPLIDVDLHMHTDHSYDCATPVEVLLATARVLGLRKIHQSVVVKGTPENLGMIQKAVHLLKVEKSA